MDQPEKLLEVFNICAWHSTATQSPVELRVRAFMGSPVRGMESYRGLFNSHPMLERE